MRGILQRSSEKGTEELLIRACAAIAAQVFYLNVILSQTDWFELGILKKKDKERLLWITFMMF